MRRSSVLDSLSGSVFVAQQGEMEELNAALDESRFGQGKLVTLLGEPRIGKNRAWRAMPVRDLCFAAKTFARPFG